MVDLSIVIISWNVRDLLEECLRSLNEAQATSNRGETAALNVEIIVVDSASEDDSAQMIREKHPTAQLLAQEENIGFTRGNNVGLARAQGEYILLLNPDTEVSPDALGTMIEYMDEHPAGRYSRPAYTKQRWQPSVDSWPLPYASDRHF